MDTINTFLMVGRPGSGKGTQAALLAEKIGSPIFSTGGEFRSLASGESYLGKRLKGAMEGGELLPHWLASYTFQKVIFGLEPQDKIVFEGACRTGPEAELFHEMSLWLPRPYKAIYLALDEEEAWKRLLLRAGKEHRKDDTEESIRIRFEEYKKKNEAVIDCFRAAGTLVEVNGDQTVEEVRAEVMRALQL